jgi:hypothetical protein
MNVFILNTGRCGSTTFIQACQHINNYSALHESRVTLIGEQRLAYPPNHIEADNRLSWFLGRLEQRFGDAAFYVHLSRDLTATAESFSCRTHFGIMQAYRQGILLGGQQHSDQALAFDYLETVNSNIGFFLKDKTHKMNFRLESAAQDFSEFWERIGAQGDLAKALAEWNTRYNASEGSSNNSM